MHRQSGFTLIEVMITIAIVAILAAIAIPNYANYLTRGKIQEATSNLLGMRVKMEQYFQDNRMYVSPGGGVLAPCTAGSSVPLPTLKYFSITCNPAPTANTYTIRADGTDKAVAGLRLEINEANQRWTRTAPAGWNVSGLPKQCWVSKTNGDC
jgi:type IV pilus assembly protein PilE